MEAIVDGKSVKDHIAVIAMDEDVFYPTQKCARLQKVATRMNESVMPNARAKIKFAGKNGTLCKGPDVTSATCGQVLTDSLLTFERQLKSAKLSSTGKGHDDLAKLLSTENSRTLHTLLASQAERISSKDKTANNAVKQKEYAEK